jgi:hypothetical protein
MPASSSAERRRMAAVCGSAPSGKASTADSRVFARIVGHSLLNES